MPGKKVRFISASPYMVPGSGGGGGMGPSLPPLPPRPTSTMTSYSTYPRPAYGSYNTMGMYGNGMYGGTYRGYGQYGMGGMPDMSDDNGFLQIAENSSRQAFQSIESIVHAFGSVSMMLESTYHAVYSTFRAVLGVADHFNRMKSHFAQIFSALAIVRTLRWLYHRLLYLIGLRSQDPSLESVWRNASSSLPGAQQITESDIKASKSSWPIVMFLGVVFGGPYLIWRLLSSLVPTKSKAQGWIKGQEEHYAAVAQYPFQAKTRNELSFVSGQQLILAPKDQQPSLQGWLLASNGKNIGLVPANYIKIVGLHPPQLQQAGNTQEGQKGNPMMASRIPTIPSPQLRTCPSLPEHTVPYMRNFEPQPGTPHMQQRPLTTSQQGAAPAAWQRAPVTTWQRAPLTQQGVPPAAWQRLPPTIQQGPPLTTQQGPPLTTQQGPPLTTQQGPPLTTQQGPPPTTQQGPPSLTTQQGTPLTTQQGLPLTTHQPLTTQPPPLTTQQDPPLITQQDPPLITQQEVPKSPPSSPSLSQPATSPPQNTPPFTPESLDGAVIQRTSPQMDGETFNIDEPDGTNGDNGLEE
ncbi:peroxisomal membrane protein PEX13-like isoform X2 [Portunus trituberculatus]|uniref:peroxisomal membrane protein PEX13-like isoform X2 n=1 Tax=Portunus trituberculatus TaxID=210409 RepID=UPI001E1CE05C|nr:peroxisomal membrane protein PEX13-like isoform X2 [Portunus trituberculatus]